MLSPLPSDKQTVREFFYAVSMMERGKPILNEMIWVLMGRYDLERHEQILPDYCYNIFDVFRRTLFKGFPLLSETVVVIDQAGLASAKTVEAARKVIRIEWKNLGRMVGIGSRCLRFTELESADEFNRGDTEESTPDKDRELFTIIFGRPWLEQNSALMTTQPVEQIFAKMLNQYLATWLKDLQTLMSKFDDLAYQCSPAAMSEFNEGFIEGLNSFIDVDGQFTGESPRTGIYGFLLLLWPEMNAMLESNPKKTLTDLHEWLQPFMRRGLIPMMDIDSFRDICEPPPKGIGLSLRPLKARSAK